MAPNGCLAYRFLYTPTVTAIRPRNDFVGYLETFAGRLAHIS